MLLGAGLVLGIGGLLVWLWYRWRSAGKEKRLAMRLQRLRGRRMKPKAVRLWLQDVYTELNITLEKQASAESCRLLDLLKLAYGEGVTRQDEPLRLMGICVAALRCKQPDVAGFAMDAFTPLLKHFPAAGLTAAAERLLVIGAIGLRQKQPFITAKVVPHLLTIMERSSGAGGAVSALRALRSVGALTLRRRDAALFRDMNTQLLLYLTQNWQPVLAQDLVACIAVWLHRIQQWEQAAALEALQDAFAPLLAADKLPEAAVLALMTECENIAGVAILNPHSKVAPILVRWLLELAESRPSPAVWQAGITALGRLNQLALERYGVRQGFSIMQPLLEQGRRWLVAELKFGLLNQHRQQALLFRVVRECVQLAGVVARQRPVATAADIMAEWLDRWLYSPDVIVNQRSAKQFLQLMLLYWLNLKQKHRERYWPDAPALTEPILFTVAERAQLGI